LHKEVSSIFSGVPLPGGDNNNTAPAASATLDKEAGHLPPKTSRFAGGPSVPQAKPQKQTSQPARQSEAKTSERSSALQKQIARIWQQVKVKLLTPPEGVSQTKHNITLLMIPVLLVIAFIVLGRLFLPSGANAQNLKDEPEVVGQAAEVKTEIEWEKPSLYPKSLRDPMQKISISQGNGEAAGGDISVRGIVWSVDKPAAVIGTQIIYQGQTVQGAKITRITQDSVEFERDGQTWVQKVSN
jgi:hypothetical protein